MAAEPFDLELPSGRLHGERSGPADGPLVIGVHGLSANVRSFDGLAPRLAAAGRHFVSLDLRGRGASEDSGPGTYGLRSHAADVLAVADAHGAERFSVIGWSMGALIGTALAEMANDRLERLVLIDHAGAMDETAVDAVIAGLARLDAHFDSREAYLDALRAAGHITEWGPFWDAFYGYEIAERGPGDWSPRTSRTACQEDIEAFDGVEVLHARWSSLTMPTLLVRGTVPIGGGLIVPPEELEALQAAVPGIEVVQVDRNHYELMTEPAALEAIARHVG
jgi:pimeloyl-ACP methyl ester carboxylesterase